MKMDRKRFMAELDNALTDRLPASEVGEVLSDYAEFFDSGLADGSSEEEISERLGDPARIALSLLSKEPRSQEGGQPAQATLSRTPKAAMHRRLSAFVDDILLAGLPILWIAPRLAIVTYFMPQYVPGMLASFLGTVRISNHGWIAAARPFWLTAIVVSGFWFFLLHPICLILFHGQTAGKRTMGLRVVRADGGPAGPSQYLVRELLGKLALNALCGLIWQPLAFAPALVSLVMSLVSRDGAAIWDHIAGTRVVELPSRRREA